MKERLGLSDQEVGRNLASEMRTITDLEKKQQAALNAEIAAAAAEPDWTQLTHDTYAELFGDTRQKALLLEAADLAPSETKDSVLVELAEAYALIEPSEGLTLIQEQINRLPAKVEALARFGSLLAGSGCIKSARALASSGPGGANGLRTRLLLVRLLKDPIDMRYILDHPADGTNPIETSIELASLGYLRAIDDAKRRIVWTASRPSPRSNSFLLANEPAPKLIYQIAQIPIIEEQIKLGNIQPIVEAESFRPPEILPLEQHWANLQLRYKNAIEKKLDDGVSLPVNGTSLEQEVLSHWKNLKEQGLGSIETEDRLWEYTSQVSNHFRQLLEGSAQPSFVELLAAIKSTDYLPMFKFRPPNRWSDYDRATIAYISGFDRQLAHLDRQSHEERIEEAEAQAIETERQKQLARFTKKMRSIDTLCLARALKYYVMDSTPPAEALI